MQSNYNGESATIHGFYELTEATLNDDMLIAIQQNSESAYIQQTTWKEFEALRGEWLALSNTTPAVTFTAPNGEYQIRTSAANITLTLNTTNHAKNYLIIHNTNTRLTSITVTIEDVQFEGRSVNVYYPSSITIGVSSAVEISFAVPITDGSSTYAIVTSSNALTYKTSR